MVVEFPVKMKMMRMMKKMKKKKMTTTRMMMTFTMPNRSTFQIFAQVLKILHQRQVL